MSGRLWFRRLTILGIVILAGVELILVAGFLSARLPTRSQSAASALARYMKDPSPTTESEWELERRKLRRTDQLIRYGAAIAAVVNGAALVLLLRKLRRSPPWNGGRQG